jgi:hypothetical protein
MYKRNPLSGVSIAITSTMDAHEKKAPLIDKNKTSEFTIKIANRLEERDAAFRLAYQAYLEKGYIKENFQEKLIRNYDQDNETVIFIVQDKFKNVVGSATLVFDESIKLPADKVYTEELKELRKRHTNIAELCRLVISNEFRNSIEILVLLFNYAAIYITQVKKCHGLAVEVNPRHKNYYKALLSFDEIGIEKPCPQVQNAAGILLYLPANKYQKIILNRDFLGSKERSLYPYFLNTEQESLVAYYLKKQTKPLTAEEKIYFGFTESGSFASCKL